MKTSSFSRFSFLFVGVVLSIAVSASTAYAQEAPLQSANTGGVLGQLSAVFSGDRTVQTVELSGNATWYAGSLEDSGPVSLTASTDGSSQMQLTLAATGQRTETRTGAGPSADCQWAGSDGVAHEMNAENCWKPMLWFLPNLSLQPSSMPAYVGTVDLGLGRVGSGATVYRHVRSQLVLSGFSSTLAADVAQRSITDLGLDPVSLLPSVLTYQVHPDNGSQVNVTIEIRYSDYRQVNGAMIPYRIQRYVNGALQLDIQVSSVQLS